MKKLIVAALMASAAAAAPVSICDTNAELIGTKTLSVPDASAAGCTWKNGATVETYASSKTLTITGGSTEGEVTIDLDALTAPFRLEVKGGLTATGAFAIKGALPKDSSILVSGITFDTKPTTAGPLSLLDLSALTTTKSTVTAEGNTFKVDLSGVNAATTCACVALGTKIDGSTVTIRKNVASAKSHATRTDGKVIGLSATGSIVRSSVAFTGNTVKGDGQALVSGASIALDEAAELGTPAAGTTVWSTVTDKRAREDFGKSSFEIAGNVLEAVTADVEAWSIADKGGSDWTIKGTEAKSSGGAVTGSFALDKPFYGISVSVAGNKLQALASAKTPTISFAMDKIPPNSAVSADGNTLVSGATATVAAFTLTKETFLPRSSDFAIENNALAAVDGRKVDLAGTQFVVEYTFANTATGRSAPVALCGNTLFGNKINTNALVDETIKATNNVNLLVADVDKCALRRRSAAPQRAAASAAGALASIAVAGAALLVL